MLELTRAQLAQKITHLQKLNNIISLNTDVSILLRCNVSDENNTRTIIYELKQCDTFYDIAFNAKDLIQDSIKVYLDKLNQIPVI
jgi:hypothetical protein